MKPSIPKGTRDFSPDEMARRNFIFDTIKSVYQRYGFQQIETPSMENIETLTGKYGEEGDKLIFKILNSGNYFSEFRDDNEIIRTKNQGEKLFTSKISEKALRYDLTVPFARYVVQHQNEIIFPFKRFQIQPVWRADRPQKGRYREFYQCDADIIGSNSLLNELELIQIIDDVFSQLKINVKIKINNRKILQGIAEVLDLSEKFYDLIVTIDKLDKIGYEGVLVEFKEKGISEEKIKFLEPYLTYYQSDSFEHKISRFRELFNASEVGKKGVEEIETIFSFVSEVGIQNSKLELDITLARGLNYYTGAIIEVKANDIQMGSICGGGRYDDLTGIFGLPNLSGVGISFGADRIYDVLEEMNSFPGFSNVSTKILFVNFGDAEAKYCLKLVKRLRDDGINAELYPDSAKMKKQLSYADYKKIPYVALIGSEELKTEEITIKNLGTGEQSKVTMDELLHILK